LSDGRSCAGIAVDACTAAPAAFCVRSRGTPFVDRRSQSRIAGADQRRCACAVRAARARRPSMHRGDVIET